MLKLYQSNRLESLLGLLADVLAEPLASPLIPEAVVTPHPGMARWLSLRLAERQGICANMQFPMPAAFIWQVFRALLADVPEHGRFEPAVLSWRILELLDGLEDDKLFAPVQAYLAEADDVKHYELALRLAATFDQYLLYRPDWVTAWECGRPALEGDAWQAELWRRLAAPGAGAHWVHLQQRLMQVLASGKAPLKALPQRVALFGMPSLSPGYTEILHSLAEYMEVHLFLLNPCAEHWTEIVAEAEKARREIEVDGTELYLEVGNPLLASLGRQGRDFFASILEYDPGSVEGYADPGQDSLLHRVQSDILNLSDTGSGERLPLPRDDASLQIHSCHSPMRELEVLRDQLLDLFQQHPDLEPSDVLVMTPDIDAYAPYIEAVFSESADYPAIPYSVADRGAVLDSPLLAAFFSLLQIGRSRLDAEDMLALLEVPALRRRYNLAERDLGQITRWVEQAGIRWGRDGKGKGALGLPDTDQNTWQAGLDRLLLGYALPGEGERLFHGVLPYDEVEGANAGVLGGLYDFAEAVFDLQQRLADKRRVDAWGRELFRLVGRFFDPSEEEENGIQVIRGAIEAMLQQAEFAGFNQAVSVDMVCAHLKSQAGSGKDGGRFLSGGMSFCAMTPMRSLPFQIICLVGMNDGQFPRQHRSPGFDLMAQRFRLGDRSRRADDRYLFLETLVSARRCLYISYVGQDVRDNSPLPPSVLVGELLDYLERSYCTGDGACSIGDVLLTRHPLQGFSPKYFMPETGLFSYSSQMRATSQAATKTGAAAIPFVTQSLAEPESEWRCVELETLFRFFSNPTRFLLQKRLDIQLKEGEELLETREPFELDYFVANDLAQRLVEAERAGQEKEAVCRLLRAGGVLPHGMIGERIFERVRIEAGEFTPKLMDLYEEPLDEPLEIGLAIGEMQLQGRLGGVGRHGIFGYSVHKIWDNQLLGLWIRHLTLNVLQPDGVEPLSRWLDAERLYCFQPVDQASDYLGQLLELYWQGLRRPLHFFPKSGREYMQHLIKSEDEAAALKKAWVKWGGEFNANPESADPYYRLAFPGGDVLDEEFQQLSERVFRPLYEHLLE